jgi:hypothetical protein
VGGFGYTQVYSWGKGRRASGDGDSTSVSLTDWCIGSALLPIEADEHAMRGRHIIVRILRFMGFPFKGALAPVVFQ